MKKLIYIIILLVSVLIIGCSNENQVKDKQSKSDNSSFSYQKSSENEIDDTENDIESVENEPLGEKIDVSSMMDVIEPILFRMVPDVTGEDKDYSELFSKKELSETAYIMILSRSYDTEATDLEKYYDENGHVKMERSVLNSYLKVAFNEFDNSLIDDIYSEEGDYYLFKYLESSDSYSISPADGGGWVNTDIIDAYSNGDGTYKAIIDVTMDYDVDSEYIGKYAVTLVKNNDSSSKFEYSITNIEKN